MQPSVLVSAGRESIFFLVAGTALCFGFSMRTMLIATTKNVSVLSGAHPKLGIFSFPCSASKQVCKKLGGSIAGAADLN